MRSSLLLLILFIPAASFSQHALELGSFRFPSTADNENAPAVVLDIGSDFGVMFGMLQEWVFVNRGGNTSYVDVLSRLDWQANALVYAGVSGNIRPSPRFHVAFGCWIGIPGPLGIEEDRDWNYATGIYEIYSRVDNTLLNAFFYDFNAGYAFVDADRIVLNGLIGFNFKQIRMIGRDGWQESPPGTFQVYLIGDQIDYEVNFFIPYIGCETKWTPVRWFSGDIFLSVSPWLTFAYARDAHLNPSAPGYYQDLPQFGFYFSGIASLTFRFGDRLAVSVKNTFMWAPPIKGPTFAGGDLDPAARGGAGLILYSLSASLHVALSH